MADPYPNPPRPSRPVTTTTYGNSASATFLRNLRAHTPNSTQLISFVTLIITMSILLFLAGISVTGAFLGLLFCAPLIILTSPIWFPVAAVVFTAVTGFLLFCGFSVTAVAGLSWIYRYLRGMNPPGSDRVNYARSRIYDTASHVKDYAREYGGYLQSRVKDAAPGA